MTTEAIILELLQELAKARTLTDVNIAAGTAANDLDRLAALRTAEARYPLAAAAAASQLG